ncbi:MAG: FkbM family methyltransferase, partial [Candidatus Acidiferrum sp.]
HAFKVAYRDQILDRDQHAEVINFVARCDPRMVLFDIGAHYGIFSLIAAHRGATVIAVEPSTAAVRMIARQAALNHESDRIHIVHAAASSGSGTLKMLGSGVFSDDYFRVVEGRSPRELMSVRAVTIDSLAAEFGSPTHIKIDVEGQEAAVLAGGRETLARHSPELFLELHNQMISEAGGEPSAALNELRTLGYRTFALDGVPIVQGQILQQTLVRLVATKDGHA